MHQLTAPDALRQAPAARGEEVIGDTARLSDRTQPATCMGSAERMEFPLHRPCCRDDIGSSLTLV